MELSEEIKAPVAGLFRADTYVAEAEFGLRELWPTIRELPTGAQVLEIGSGPGLLMSELARRRPELDWTGVEPFGSGFSYFEEITVAFRREYEFTIEPVGYEEFESESQFDLIFLVNVFEHLPDWRDFLHFVRSRLTLDGRCIVLCPNYTFPYESHFGLPVLGTKALTGRVFQSKIRAFEEATHTQGLWSSLNFVKAHEVEFAVRRLGMKATFDPAVTSRLIKRLQSDQNFADRHGFVGGAARLIARLGVTQLLETPGFHLAQPYMKFELTLR